MGMPSHVCLYNESPPVDLAQIYRRPVSTRGLCAVLKELTVHCPSSSDDATGQVDRTAVRSVLGQLSVNESSEVVNVDAVRRPPGWQVPTDPDALRCFDTGVGISCAMLTDLGAKSPRTALRTLCEIDGTDVFGARRQLSLNQSSEMIYMGATHSPFGEQFLGDPDGLRRLHYAGIVNRRSAECKRRRFEECSVCEPGRRE
jgi:hypothetical protein